VGHEDKMTLAITPCRRLRTNFDTCTMPVPKICSQPIFRAANTNWYLHQNRVRSVIYNITMLSMDRPATSAWPRFKTRSTMRSKGTIPSATLANAHLFPAFHPLPGAALLRAPNGHQHADLIGSE